MKKILIVFSILLISGCNNNDINKESIVTSIYISNNMTCFYIVPNEKDSYLDKIVGTGNDLHEMFNDIKNKANKTLYFNHLSTIIINENITYINLSDFIEKTMLPNTVNIVIAKDIDKIIDDYLKLAPFETPSTTLLSKDIKLINYRELKNNKNSYLPFINYNDAVNFVGYKKIQP